MPDGSTSTKLLLVLEAERLFGEHGLEGVSLRRIGLAAGNANKSVVQYHFGAKEELVQAIFEYRLAGLHARREELVAQFGTDDVRSWLRCHLLAILEQAEQPDSHYMRFISQLLQHPSTVVRIPAEPLRARVAAFHDRLGILLGSVAEPVRTHRISYAQQFMTYAAAHRERAREAGVPTLPLPAAAADLIESMAGFLQAPAADSTRAVVPPAASDLLTPLL